MWEDAPTEDTAPESAVVTIGEDQLGGHQCEVGDKLTFTVVSKEDGQVGLKMEGYGGEEESGESEGEMTA